MTTTKVDADGNLRVFIDFKFCKVSGRKRCILPPGLGSEEKRNLLLETLARDREWARMVCEGEFENGQRLADAIGMDQSYVGRHIKLAFLSPYAVCRIVDGNFPDEVSLALLIEASKTPIWKEQHKILGID